MGCRRLAAGAAARSRSIARLRANEESQRSREEPEINLIPLIDVMLFLLIFFVVTTTFTHNTGITLNLPEATQHPLQEQQQPLEVIVDAQGRYFIDDRMVVNRQIETLKKALQLAAKGMDHPALIISADANATTCTSPSGSPSTSTPTSAADTGSIAVNTPARAAGTTFSPVIHSHTVHTLAASA